MEERPCESTGAVQCLGRGNRPVLCAAVPHLRTVDRREPQRRSRRVTQSGKPEQRLSQMRWHGACTPSVEQNRRQIRKDAGFTRKCRCIHSRVLTAQATAEIQSMTRTRTAALAQSLQRFSEKIMLSSSRIQGSLSQESKA